MSAATLNIPEFVHSLSQEEKASLVKALLESAPSELDASSWYESRLNAWSPIEAPEAAAILSRVLQTRDDGTR